MRRPHPLVRGLRLRRRHRHGNLAYDFGNFAIVIIVIEMGRRATPCLPSSVPPWCKTFAARLSWPNPRKEEGRVSELPTMVALGDDYPELRESVHKICERYPGEYWRKLEAEQAYPTEFIAELTQSGFLASLIPEEYGGSGLPLRAAAVILEEINASGCTASQGHAQMYIMGTLLRHGNEQQKRRYLPKIASGELRLQAFGVTEPTTGSDTTKLKTRAIKAMINHNTTEVFFDNLQVPPENLIGEEGRGFRYILDGMNAERILVAQECIGDGRWLLNKGIEYAKERIVFDRPIGQNQGVQFPLARAYAELEAADMICRRAAALFDAGQECGADANMAKLLASEAG